ncbi:MAG: ATP-dependent DNA helicase RecG, partial [Bacteroidales bacterium OttesenSCG-928-I14]|nr:ATP-dependent DNA helicase RecG [Bacteroidales bacterium OttesenSCG-928-I14]
MDISRQSIRQLQCTKPDKVKVLKEEINVFSWKDLLYYFPYRYTDRSKIHKISEIDGRSMPFIQLKGKIFRYEYLGEGKSRRLSAVFDDGTGVIELIWFRSLTWITKMYKLGREYILFGKPSTFRLSTPSGSSLERISIIHPELEEENKFYEGVIGIQGEYSTTEKMKKVSLHSRTIKQMIIEILENIKEPLSE